MDLETTVGIVVEKSVVPETKLMGAQDVVLTGVWGPSLSPTTIVVEQGSSRSWESLPTVGRHGQSASGEK